MTPTALRLDPHGLLTIGGGLKLEMLKVARNDVKDDLMKLAKCLGVIIEKYTGVKLVM